MTVRTLPVPAPAAPAPPCPDRVAEDRPQRSPIPRQFAAANRQRTAQATVTSAVNVSLALDALGGDVAPHLLEAARLRIDEPALALSALARLAGCTKDALAGRLRRLVKQAGLLPPGKTSSRETVRRRQGEARPGK